MKSIARLSLTRRRSSSSCSFSDLFHFLIVARLSPYRCAGANWGNWSSRCGGCAHMMPCRGRQRIAIHARDSCVHILYPRRQFPGLPSFIFRGIGAGAAGPLVLPLAGSFSLAGFAGFGGFMGDVWTGVTLIWRILGDDVLLGISGLIDNTTFHLTSPTTVHRSSS